MVLVAGLYVSGKSCLHRPSNLHRPVRSDSPYRQRCSRLSRIHMLQYKYFVMARNFQVDNRACYPVHELLLFYVVTFLQPVK